MSKAKEMRLSDEEREEMARPREYDRLAIGKAMIAYARENPDCWTIPQFASTIDMCSDILCDWADLDPEFRRYYLQAKEQIGINRLLATSQDILHNTIYHRGAGLYDSTLHRFERGEKTFESKLKQVENQSISQDDRARFEALENQLNEVRTETRARKSKPKGDND
jgi:hypothetical protein